LLFEDNPIPMFTYDRQTLQILSANDLALKKYGYSREELLQKRITDIRPEEDIPALLQMLHDPPEGSTVGPLRHRRKDGSVFWVAVTCHSLSGEDPALRIIVAQDVSEQVRLNAELVRRANYDLLTGLPNRSLLIDRFRLAVERAKRTGQRIAVLAIDFDRFKQVNDAFGHQIGDEFLKLSTLSLLSALRQTDTLARVGGDEFIVLADCLNSTEACTEIAARLITALNNPISVRDLELQSSISIGIAFYPDDGDDFEEIHRRADYSLYQAKRSGRGCWRYYSQHETYGIQESMEIERSLRKALSDGRFELHYQPIVSPDKEVVKLEALLRFPHPTLGLLSPARFVPVAEETGLIAPIGQWVLQQACRQIQQWHSEGLSVVPIAVNVSAAQFLHGNLADDIRKLLEEFEVEPNLLEIELTESLLMENTEYSWEQLRVLKRAGIRIAVDDFGTGYSSLSYLHLLPLARISHRC
jgi:diguanylate cyclase (GGDEF)-like protein/PAS domain S-box-containing protein